MAPQITSLTIIYWSFYSGPDQRKRQSTASLAFVWHKGPVTRKIFPFDDVILINVLDRAIFAGTLAFKDGRETAILFVADHLRMWSDILTNPQRNFFSAAI